MLLLELLLCVYCKSTCEFGFLYMPFLKPPKRYCSLFCCSFKNSIPFPQAYGRRPGGKIKLGEFAEKCLGDVKTVDNRTCSADGYGFIPFSIQEVARPQVPWLNFRDQFKEALPQFASASFEASEEGNPPHLACPQLSIGPTRSGSNMFTSTLQHTLLMDGVRNWWFLPPMLGKPLNS